jgi:pyruvate kinase
VQRRTRIVATLGPATDRPGVLEKLIETGLVVARINFSHGSGEESTQRIARLRQVAKTLNRPVAVLADLPGPKLRVILPQPLELTVNQPITVAARAGAAADVALTEPEALEKIQIGQRVLFDDGRIQATVTAIAGDRVTLTVAGAGRLLPNKGLNLPDTDLSIPAVTERDRAALAVAAQAGVDWVALSFVRQAAAAGELRDVMRGFGLNVPILAKIERPEAVGRADEIIQAFDGIMVARGDLGVEIPLERVPHVQKKLINQARIAGKPVITATDMLDSMRHSPRPTRAEASDVANAVYDGTDAVMLSGETAVGDHPVAAATYMHQILLEAELNQAEDGPKHLSVPRGELNDHMTHITCELAAETQASVIIVPTITGRTARLMARHRPQAAIVAVTSEPVVRQLGVVWGVQGVAYPFDVKPGDDRLEGAVRAAFQSGAVKPGALAVLLAGHPIEGGEGLPTLRVVRMGDDGKAHEP